MLGQLLIAEMRDSHRRSRVASTSSFKRWENWAGRKLRRATGRCAERKNAAVALLDEIIRRESRGGSMRRRLPRMCKPRMEVFE